MPPGTRAPVAPGLPPQSRGSIFARGLAVLAGWYATVVAAVGLWLPTLSDVAPGDDGCSSFGCGFSPRESATLGLLLVSSFVGPISVAAAVATLGLTVVKPIRSSVVAGTLAAAVGVIGVPAVVAVATL